MKCLRHARRRAAPMMANASAHHGGSSIPNANRDETEIGLIENEPSRPRGKAVNTAVHVTSRRTFDRHPYSCPYCRRLTKAAARSRPAGITTVTWAPTTAVGGDWGCCRHQAGRGRAGDYGRLQRAVRVAMLSRSSHAGPGDGRGWPALTTTSRPTTSRVRALATFSHEFYVSGLDTTTTDITTDPRLCSTTSTRQRVILFTDLKQAKATVPSKERVTVTLVNVPVSTASSRLIR